MKMVATRMLRRYGFRRVLLANGGLTTLATLVCAALTPSTPYVVIVVVLFANGLTRSLQFSALNSLAFADVPPEQMSTTNALANVVQQLTLGLGITAAAVAVHLATLLHREVAVGPTLTDFHTAIVAAAIMTAVSTLDALTRSQDAGLHQRPPSVAVEAQERPRQLGSLNLDRFDAAQFGRGGPLGPLPGTSPRV
jgi:MFS family permease